MMVWALRGTIIIPAPIFHVTLPINYTLDGHLSAFSQASCAGVALRRQMILMEFCNSFPFPTKKFKSSSEFIVASFKKWYNRLIIYPPSLNNSAR
jgi:hypothetical protein